MILLILNCIIIVRWLVFNLSRIYIAVFIRLTIKIINCVKQIVAWFINTIVLLIFIKGAFSWNSEIYWCWDSLNSVSKIVLIPVFIFTLVIIYKMVIIIFTNSSNNNSKNVNYTFRDNLKAKVKFLLDNKLLIFLIVFWSFVLRTVLFAGIDINLWIIIFVVTVASELIKYVLILSVNLYKGKPLVKSIIFAWKKVIVIDNENCYRDLFVIITLVFIMKIACIHIFSKILDSLTTNAIKSSNMELAYADICNSLEISMNRQIFSTHSTLEKSDKPWSLALDSEPGPSTQTNITRPWTSTAIWSSLPAPIEPVFRAASPVFNITQNVHSYTNRPAAYAARLPRPISRGLTSNRGVFNNRGLFPNRLSRPASPVLTNNRGMLDNNALPLPNRSIISRLPHDPVRDTVCNAKAQGVTRLQIKRFLARDVRDFTPSRFFNTTKHIYSNDPPRKVSAVALINRLLTKVEQGTGNANDVASLRIYYRTLNNYLRDVHPLYNDPRNYDYVLRQAKGVNVREKLKVNFDYVKRIQDMRNKVKAVFINYNIAP